MKSGLRFSPRALMATVTAAITAMTGVVVGAGTASAANRDELRPDATGTCEWDPHGYGVQRCDVWSPSMGRNIAVQIQPSERGGDAGLYFLDGLRATELTNGWMDVPNAPAVFEHDNITLVMPVGGPGSFYADWNAPAKYDVSDPVNYQWETFLSQELPPYLEANFGVSPVKNSVLGISMGATGAMNLAAKHPEQFKQVFSLSGYLTNTVPGAQTLMRVALLDAGGFNLNAMYGSVVSPKRFANDPLFNMGGLRGTDVYVTAATGIPGPADLQLPIQDIIAGSPLETISRASTQAWATTAKMTGISVTENYPIVGLHNWGLWVDQLNNHIRPRVLDVMGAA
ncbi:alpha/beta hydrolase [Corynebacterium lowii]|uniref:Diacylglycerol acyltransferase/mycolyltransferase Ag85C n=1 Tax=Corynebacterium lowii TaxID=1544413 RepID=A0A0Q0YBR0_9CORY|nr:alpha/beta hydrolase family protein [Corynebacterium lowii]KQB83463.1 Diacylglycerol acyltransferase/mycolyltransferase Ag85C precursor [Corynebacterium lowii]MDP9852509.1 diacylglycerol O-acyltransferase/trehalose O-mycolyltransferase [Corynebacterium lowii]